MALACHLVIKVEMVKHLRGDRVIHWVFSRKGLVQGCRGEGREGEERGERREERREERGERRRENKKGHREEERRETEVLLEEAEDKEG
jgi:hypothetical protein